MKFFPANSQQDLADISRDAPLQRAVTLALDTLLADQRDDGHWVYELEADATIPAEYILMVHYLGETPDLALICGAFRVPMEAGHCFTMAPSI